jgi:outer membrane protein assembly factor BamB
MKLSKRFRDWLSGRGALALFILLVVLFAVLQAWLQRPLPRITHTLGSSTQQVDVLWFKQDDFSNMVATNAGEMAFMIPLELDNLIAINVKTGTVVWKVELPFERSGARGGLLADQDTVFAVPGGSVDAYEAKTGELRWSTRLGDEHVSIVSQLDSDRVRVYYGDKLFELDSESGKILTVLPKDDIVWISGDVVIKESPAYQLSAFNKQTGEPLWINNQGFYVRTGWEPQEIGRDNLIVGFVRGICALNLQTGEYSWCHPEVDISKMAIDYQSGLGYGMMDDLVLLTIDLQTGNVLGETTFFSSEPINEQIGFMSFITFSDGVVMVSFSDSGQTFGLSLKQ